MFNVIMMNLLLILTALIWGANFAVVKYALTDFSPLSFTLVRFSAASLVLIGLMVLRGEHPGIEPRDRRPFIRLGLIGITLYNVFFMYGLKYTSASNSALFISTSPLFAALILAVSRKERFSIRTGTGFVFSFIGVFLILGGTPGGIRFTRTGLTGDLLTLCASVFWALYTLNAKPLLAKYSALKVTAYSMATGSLLLIPLALPEILNQSWSTVPVQAWSALGYAVFLSGSLAFTLWYQGIKILGITKTIVYQYLIPVVALIVAAVFLHDRMSLLQIGGAAAVLGGVYLVQKNN